MPYLIAFLLLATSLFAPPAVAAVGLNYDAGKTYGTLNMKGGIEISPSITEAQARDLAAAFAATNVYLKIANPSASFTSSPVFTILNSIAGGWYISAADAAPLPSFTKATAKPVVFEVTPFNAAVIRDIKARYPAVKIHAGGFMLWPREDIRTVFQTVPPPAIEAASVKMESDVSGDMFPVIKLMFDTFFDGSGDITGASTVKINYPAGSALALSGINPKGGDGYRKSAYRFGVEAAAAVTSVQFQNRDGKAPYRYVIAGPYQDLSASDKIIAARFSRFLASNPAIIWPMAIKENGDPYDNTFLKESNSKPVVGIIGTIGGSTEGILINASSQNTPVELPYSVSANAYSSYVGPFLLSTSLQLSPHEVVVFGANISRSSPPPPVSVPPTRTPTLPQNAPANPTAPPPPRQQPTAPALPSATAVPFQIATPVPAATDAPLPGQPVPPGGNWRQYLRLSLVKIDPFLKAPLSVFSDIRQLDSRLEAFINGILSRLITRP